MLIHGHTGSVWALLALPGGRLVSISTDHSARIWDLNSGTELLSIQHSAWITALCRLEDGRVASACGGLFSDNNIIRIWDPKSGAETIPLEGYGVQRESILDSRL